jgi:hypothetical protein
VRMKKHLVKYLLNYQGHAIQAWWADGAWHYQAALSRGEPLPAVGAGGFKTSEQAITAAAAFVDGMHAYRNRHLDS